MIEKIAGTYVIDAASKVRAKKAYGGGTRNEADEASFSPFAVELARVTGEMKNIPEIREDLVNDIRMKVEAGEYHPPIDQIARNLFIAGILNAEG